MAAIRQPGTARPGPLLDVARAAGVLLLVLGVLAMHQLAGGGHMAGAMTGARGPSDHAAVTSAHTGPAGPAAGMAGHRPAAAMPGGARLASQPTSWQVEAVVRVSAVAAGYAAMPVCLAVLSLLLLLVVRRGLRLSDRARAVLPQVARRTSPPGRGPPRALLAQICVLRT